jgi:hypothetical protein
MGDARRARATCRLLIEQRDRAFERDVAAGPELVHGRQHCDLRRETLAHQIAAVRVDVELDADFAPGRRREA